MNKEFLKLINVDFMQGVEEPWCNNQGVAILPYALKDNEYYYLLVKENNPLFKDKEISEYGTITGGLENLDPYQTVINEMFEETGIKVKSDKSKIYYLGKHYANKSSTKLWYFFAIDLTNQNLSLTTMYKGVGDGTEAEKEINAKFITYKDLKKSNDILSLAVHSKLKLKDEYKDELENEKIENFVEEYLQEFQNFSNDKDWTYSIPQNEWNEWNNDLNNELKKLNESNLISSELINELKKEAREYAEKEYKNELEKLPSSGDRMNEYLSNTNQEEKITPVAYPHNRHIPQL